MTHKMPSGVSEGQEEFLELLIRMTSSGGYAKTGEIAARLNTRLGTVTNLVERLERKGLLVHRPYRGVYLTSKGRRVAQDVLKRHMVLEEFLIKVLSIPSDRAHKYACRLEHAVDKEVVEAIERFLASFKAALYHGDR